LNCWILDPKLSALNLEELNVAVLLSNNSSIGKEWVSDSSFSVQIKFSILNIDSQSFEF
jgi:hypothetical protein